MANKEMNAKKYMQIIHYLVTIQVDNWASHFDPFTGSIFIGTR